MIFTREVYILLSLIPKITYRFGFWETDFARPAKIPLNFALPLKTKHILRIEASTSQPATRENRPIFEN